jgi:hypothetical protein
LKLRLKPCHEGRRFDELVRWGREERDRWKKREGGEILCQNPERETPREK